MKFLTIDGLFDPGLLLEANAAWPADDWPGWVKYDPAYECKRASNLQTPLPAALSALLAKLAGFGLGALLGLPESVADLSLCGGGLHAMPAGGGLGNHLDADGHPRLGLARVWSAVLWVHPSWGQDWGGELVLVGAPCKVIAPMPGRLAAFDCRQRRHRVEPVRCPRGVERRSLALFGYLPEPAAGERPRALFDAAAAASR